MHYLLILIIGVTLFPKAYALKCGCDTDGTPCKSGRVKDCPGTQQCAALLVQVTNEKEKKGEVNIMRNCMPVDLCKTGSVYIGIFSHYESIQCCNSTDLCNDKFSSHDGKYWPFPSGKKCYTCTDPENCGDTQTTLVCESKQDRCISVMEYNGGRNKTMIGCATQSLCGDSQYMLNMLKINVSNDATISCCEDDFCNSVRMIDPTSTAVNPTSPTNRAPGSTGAISLLFLVAPVMLASGSG